MGIFWKKAKNWDFSFFNKIYQNLRFFGIFPKYSRTVLLTIQFCHSKLIVSMLDTSFNHFGINSKFKIPKRYGFVQNMSLRELQK